MQQNSGPIIFSGDKPFDFNNPSPNRPNQSRFLIQYLIGLILALLAAFVFIQIIKLAGVFTHPKLTNLNVNTLVPLSLGRIALSSPSQKYQLGQTIPVKVKIFTGGRTIQGVDLNLSYDPNLLELTGPAYFQKGQIFSEYPITSIDKAKGVVRISGIASIAQIGYNGVGYFGTLNFTAKNRGTPKVVLEFKPNTTTDTNMIEYGSGQDILDSVNELLLNID